MDVLWLTAGLGCDGETISITAATQRGLEELMSGALPWVAKVELHNRATGQPVPTCDWIDRLAPHAWAIVAAGTCATCGGIHAMQGNPTGAMGQPDYPGWQWKPGAGVPFMNQPGQDSLPKEPSWRRR
jgi:hydrogenase small subunit